MPAGMRQIVAADTSSIYKSFSKTTSNLNSCLSATICRIDHVPILINSIVSIQQQRIRSNRFNKRLINSQSIVWLLLIAISQKPIIIDLGDIHELVEC
jgi:hypothetical protein